MSSVILGTDVETGQEVRIGDVERRSGLYILGRPGMGKSALMVNLADADTAHCHRLFFLDPHGDAITELIRRGQYRALHSFAYLFDPEDEEYSFGINLLQCSNIASRQARLATYTKAYNVFYKIWEEHWGVWLQLILQNVLWAFIENQDYTLAEVPMFLNPRNEDFRNHIISNIRYNPAVAEFWQYEFFDSKRREQTQQERVDAALTRINTLLTHPDVRDIVGQQQTTIDFTDFLEDELPKFLLFKLSANLPEDIKRFIGTILIGELLHAVRNRPENKREQCCIFIDEFHNFASSDDMGTLVTEGRKFGVATTFAHVERYGQLANNQKLMGATAATVNKVFFQTTVKDAEESAPEFAKEVEATEKRREPELVISPHPIEDIWEKGHPNRDIMDIRQRHFSVVDLLRSKPNESYYVFDPVKAQSAKDNEIALQWDEFNDWAEYRSTPEMIREGIALLNKYYYQRMHDKPYVTKKQHPTIKSDGELDYYLKLVECFGGIFGFRPTMKPYIPDNMRLLYAKRMNELRERESDRAKRESEELRRLRPRDPIPEFWITKYTKLEDVPTDLDVRNIQQWQRKALDAGFSIHEIDQFIQWKVRPINQIELKALKHVIKNAINAYTDKETYNREKAYVFREYGSVMSVEPIYHKFGADQNKLPEEIVLPYLEKVLSRIAWQLFELEDFIYICFFLCPTILERQPVKVPSGKYDESLRVDRPQHDLVTDMVLELSRLPRFNAYAKIIQEKDGRQTVATHKIQTPPLRETREERYTPGWYDEPLDPHVRENGYKLCKRRDLIEQEIRERQNRWGRGGSPPPQTRRIRD